MPTPAERPPEATPEPFVWVESLIFLLPMTVVATLLLAARWFGWLR